MKGPNTEAICSVVCSSNIPEPHNIINCLRHLFRSLFFHKQLDLPECRNDVIRVCRHFRSNADSCYRRTVMASYFDRFVTTLPSIWWYIPIFERSPMIASWSAPRNTSDIWLVTGTHRLCTRIRRSPGKQTINSYSCFTVHTVLFLFITGAR